MQSTGSINSYAWDFNNDGTNESTLQNPSPTLTPLADTYTVKLTVTGPGGSDSEVKTRLRHGERSPGSPGRSIYEHDTSDRHGPPDGNVH